MSLKEVNTVWFVQLMLTTVTVIVILAILVAGVIFWLRIGHTGRITCVAVLLICALSLLMIGAIISKVGIKWFLLLVTIGVPVACLVTIITSVAIIWLRIYYEKAYLHPLAAVVFFAAGLVLITAFASMLSARLPKELSDLPFFSLALPYGFQCMADARVNSILVWLKRRRVAKNLPMGKFWQQVSDDFYWRHSR